MSPDIRDVLKDAAAKPTSSPDVHALWHRGARLRWARRVIAAGTMVVLALGGWAGSRVFDDGDAPSLRSEPAGRLDRLCQEVADYQSLPEMAAIFLRDNATRAEIRELQESVAEHPGVLDVTFVSKRQTYEEFKARYEDQPEFYENLPPDALPASLRVDVDDPDRLPEIAAAFESSPGVEEIRYGGVILERLERFCNEIEHPDNLRWLELLCRDPQLREEFAPRFCDEL